MRRVHREIKVTKLGPNLFESRVTIGYHPNGNQKRKKVRGHTISEVRRKVEELRQQVDWGRLVDSTTTLAEYVERWAAETLAVEDIRQNTKDDYLWQLDKYVLPYLGRYRLTDLAPQIIEKWQADLLASGGEERNGLSPNTVRHARISLSKVLTAATAHGLISRNPVALAKGPRKSEYKCRALTTEQVNALIDASSGWLRVAIIVGVKTGLRPGEVAALQWSDINFKSGYLSVNHSSHSIRGGGVELRPPKTESSRRMVPIAADLESVLQDWRKTQAEIGISPFVITVEGRPLRRDTFTQAFGHLARKCNIEATPHGLRHTFATALLEDGKPTAHVAELLGDSEATVANVYSHVLRPKVELREAIQAAIPINLPWLTTDHLG